MATVRCDVPRTCAARYGPESHDLVDVEPPARKTARDAPLVRSPRVLPADDTLVAPRHAASEPVVRAPVREEDQPIRRPRAMSVHGHDLEGRRVTIGVPCPDPQDDAVAVDASHDRPNVAIARPVLPVAAHCQGREPKRSPRASPRSFLPSSSTIEDRRTTAPFVVIPFFTRSLPSMRPAARA